MAKGKKGSGKNYTSKGERSNISKWAKKASRAERKKNPTVKDMLKSYHHRQMVMNSPKSAKEKDLSVRYAEEDRVNSQAYQLMEQYGSVGLTWGEAVMAVKTSHLERVHSKWTPVLKQKTDNKIKK